MSESRHPLWSEVYAYTQKMAARACRNDPDAAGEIAADCFDRFLRLHGDTEMKDYEAWIGRSINGLKKNMERQKARSVDITDEDLGLERMYNIAPQQMINYDARLFASLADQLGEREQLAFSIIVDGGTVKDLCADMHIGPREAIALLTQIRIKMAQFTTPTHRDAA